MARGLLRCLCIAGGEWKGRRLAEVENRRVLPGRSDGEANQRESREGNMEELA